MRKRNSLLKKWHLSLPTNDSLTVFVMSSLRVLTHPTDVAFVGVFCHEDQNACNQARIMYIQVRTCVFLFYNMSRPSGKIEQLAMEMAHCIDHFTENDLRNSCLSLKPGGYLCQAR